MLSPRVLLYAVGVLSAICHASAALEIERYDRQVHAASGCALAHGVELAVTACTPSNHLIRACGSGALQVSLKNQFVVDIQSITLTNDEEAPGKSWQWCTLEALFPRLAYLSVGEVIDPCGGHPLSVLLAAYRLVSARICHL